MFYIRSILFLWLLTVNGISFEGSPIENRKLFYDEMKKDSSTLTLIEDNSSGGSSFQFSAAGSITDSYIPTKTEYQKVESWNTGAGFRILSKSTDFYTEMLYGLKGELDLQFRTAVTFHLTPIIDFSLTYTTIQLDSSINADTSANSFIMGISFIKF